MPGQKGLSIDPGLDEEPNPLCSFSYSVKEDKQIHEAGDSASNTSETVEPLLKNGIGKKSTPHIESGLNLLLL